MNWINLNIDVIRGEEYIDALRCNTLGGGNHVLAVWFRWAEPGG